MKIVSVATYNVVFVKRLNAGRLWFHKFRVPSWQKMLCSVCVTSLTTFLTVDHVPAMFSCEDITSILNPLLSLGV